MQQFYISKKGAVATALLPAALIAFVSAVFFGLGYKGAGITFLAACIICILALLVRRRGYTITLSDDFIWVQRGVLVPALVQLRLSAVLATTLVQTPVHALCKTCYLKISAAGGNVWVGGLSLADARAIQCAVEKEGGAGL